MTPFPERQQLVEWIREATHAGARKVRACTQAGLTLRTLQRWRQGMDGNDVKTDARTTTARPTPVNKLSAAESRAVLETCHHTAYAHLPPSQIVPRLADDGVYLASESTF